VQQLRAVEHMHYMQQSAQLERRHLVEVPISVAAAQSQGDDIVSRIRIKLINNHVLQ